MRFFLCSLTLTAFLLFACAVATPEPLPTVAPAPATATVTPTSTSNSTPSPQRVPLLRVAMLGETTTTNVWALFDEAGADYWNTATQAAYWPSLYKLAPPSLAFQPATAFGQPSPLKCGTFFCIATVTIQSNLRWTDGSPFSAHDVAFTVNTALQFRLGLNWQMAYNPDVLDRAEALDRTTVKFYFKNPPTVAEWQYGVLLGPLVNHAYWQPRIIEAVDLLPDESLLLTILELEGELADMQAKVDALNQSLSTMVPASTAYAETSRNAKQLQDELNSIYTRLQKNRDEYETNLARAQTSLFELTNANEPSLGSWQFASREEDQIESQVNLGTPFGDPWFDRVRYTTYPSELAAVMALQNDKVDILLLPGGLSPDGVSRLEDDPEILLTRNVTRSARFLAFNHANPYLADPVLHQALACVLDPGALVEILDGDAAPLPDFVLEEFWQNEEVSLPCSGASGEARLMEAVRLLKTVGYSWVYEPAVDVEGVGLKLPGEFEIPTLTLLAPAEDSLRGAAAKYIAQQAKMLGLSIDVKIRNSDDLMYAVYGSRNYDMALLGWRLSAYPSYLCEWFQPWGQNPFVYSGDEGMKSVCEAWSQSSELEMAKLHAYEAQAILMRDLPLIPLYSGVRFDVYRNIHYPFSEVVDGLGGLYGALELAIPIP